MHSCLNFGSDEFQCAGKKFNLPTGDFLIQERKHVCVRGGEKEWGRVAACM